jgi:hypothetical protein
MMKNVRERITFSPCIAIPALKQTVLLISLGLCMVRGVMADDITVSDQTFGCIHVI